MNPRLAVLIESMAPADLPEVLVLDRASGTNPWGHTAYAGEVLRGETKGLHLVAREVSPPTGELETPDRILGFALGAAIHDELQVLAVAVKPAWQGRGVGERLTRALIDEARRQGLLQAALEVRASNLAAQALYAKLGFHAVGRRPGFYPDTREDAIVMTTSFTAARKAMIRNSSS